MILLPQQESDTRSERSGKWELIRALSCVSDAQTVPPMATVTLPLLLSLFAGML